MITHGDPIEQEKRIKYMNLVANIVMLHNVVDLTKVLNEMDQMVLDGSLLNTCMASQPIYPMVI